MMTILTKWDCYSTVIRSFFIQAVWNYERMLNVGCAFCLIPVAKRLSSREPATVRSFLSRHLGFFNANPFIATMAVGAVVKLEETGTPPEEVARLKQALCGPLGAVGDRIFWGIVRPVSAILGTIVALIKEGWWGAVIFLVVFNTVQAIARGVAFKHGYDSGFAVAHLLAGPFYKGVEMQGRRIGSLLLGFLMVTTFVTADKVLGIYSVIILIGTMAAGFFTVKRGLPMNVLFPLYIAGCAIIAHFLLSSS